MKVSANKKMKHKMKKSYEELEKEFKQYKRKTEEKMKQLEELNTQAFISNLHLSRQIQAMEALKKVERIQKL